jgi:hypothetical protein
MGMGELRAGSPVKTLVRIIESSVAISMARALARAGRRE